MAKLTLEQLKAKMERWGKEQPRALVKALMRGGALVVADIQSKRLTGQVLNVRTGTLRRSISSQVRLTATGAEAKVGTSVWYGRWWELDAPKPRPFIRPSIEAKRGRVMDIILEEMMKAYGG